MKKSFFLLGTAALSSMLMVACSDDSTNNSSSENANACSLTSTEDGLAIKCGSEEVGIIKNSKDGVYGASCMAEALRDDSGYKLVCGGDSVGVVYNGAHGINGENGTNGNPGKNGEAGTSCYAKATTDGYNLFCGDELVGEILSGARGSSCAVASTTTGAVISCEDGTTATLSNGSQGLRGLQGEQGEGCTTDGLKYTDAEDGRKYAVISCGDDELLVYDGEKGATGAGCTAIKDTKTGVTTVSCGDDEVEILDGAAGKNGDNCSIVDNENGTATITCGTGTGATTYTVNDGAAGAQGVAGYNCTSESFGGYAVISCQTGVDEDKKPVYKKDTVLAAGYVKCDGEIHESSKGVCDEGEWTAYTCGTLTTSFDAETHFCYEGGIYEKADYLDLTTNYPTADYFKSGTAYYLKSAYWTEATTYPKATYGKCDDDKTDPDNVIVGDYYLIASQYCNGTVATDKYQECGGVLFNAATHFCATDVVYALCGGAIYAPDTEFCAANVKYAKCGTETFDPGTHCCSAGVVQTGVAETDGSCSSGT